MLATGAALSDACFLMLAFPVSAFPVLAFPVLSRIADF
jgi:hypothetical protein